MNEQPNLVMLFPNGNVAAFDENQQPIGIPLMGWLEAYLYYLESKGIDPSKIKDFQMVFGNTVSHISPFRGEQGWKFEMNPLPVTEALEALMTKKPQPVAETGKLPSDFNVFPLASVVRDGNAEQVAQYIMAILSRTGNTWRNLSWDEFKAERNKDERFHLNEKDWYNKVIEYCQSAQTARLFCKDWAKIK